MILKNIVLIPVLDSEKNNYRGASIIKSDGADYKKLKDGAMSVRWIP